MKKNKNAVLYNNSNYHGYFAFAKKGPLCVRVEEKKKELKLLLDWSGVVRSGGAACTPACHNKALPVCSNSQHFPAECLVFHEALKKKMGERDHGEKERERKKSARINFTAITNLQSREEGGVGVTAGLAAALIHICARKRMFCV